MCACLFPQDPAIATSKRVNNASYDSFDRGNEKKAWVFNSDGETPLLGEVSIAGCYFLYFLYPYLLTYIYTVAS